MRRKRIAHDSLHHDRQWVEEEHSGHTGESFDYGRSTHLSVFKGTHPAVMKERIAAKDWEIDERSRACHAHDSLRVRMLSSVERLLGWRFGEYRNYVLLRRDDHPEEGDGGGT
jgi:hypothetical protein